MNAPATPDALKTPFGEARIPDTLFFARKLADGGHRLGPLVVNRVHPDFDVDQEAVPDSVRDGVELFRWLGDSHRRGLAQLRSLLPAGQVLTEVPLEADDPTDLESLAALGRRLSPGLAAKTDARAEETAARI